MLTELCFEQKVYSISDKAISKPFVVRGYEMLSIKLQACTSAQILVYFILKASWFNGLLHATACRWRCVCLVHWDISADYSI